MVDGTFVSGERVLDYGGRLAMAFRKIKLSQPQEKHSMA